MNTQYGCNCRLGAKTSIQSGLLVRRSTLFQLSSCQLRSAKLLLGGNDALSSSGGLRSTQLAHGSKKDNNSKPTASTSSSDIETEPSSSSMSAKVMASLSIVGGLVLLAAGGVLMKDQIAAFLDLFIHLVDKWGPLGYIAYMIVYAGLELLAVPAIPLTMTAGAIFGVGPGTMVVSASATAAATGAFLIARYVARDRIAKWAEGNPKFQAIDRAIGKNGFKVVTLLRLSPLLPLAASNYLYGLTSVELGAYVAGSWLGMLPGTFAYVTAGTYGKQLLTGEGLAAAGVEWWQIGVGVGFTVIALWYVGKLATDALQELEISSSEKN